MHLLNSANKFPAFEPIVSKFAPCGPPTGKIDATLSLVSLVKRAFVYLLELAFQGTYFIGSVFIGDTNRTISLRRFDIIAFQAMKAKGTKRVQPLDRCNISCALFQTALHSGLIFPVSFRFTAMAELLMSPECSAGKRVIFQLE